MTHFSLTSDLFQSKASLSYFLHTSKMQERAGNTALQGVSSAAGFGILLSSGVGTSGRYPEVPSLRRLPVYGG